MENTHNLISLSVDKIVPSPYQYRRYFDEEKLKELAASIQRDGLVEPIVVRLVRGRYELIAGERRLRAVRDYTGMKKILAHLVEADDLQARRMSASENLQRENLSAIETIEAMVEMVDAELMEEDHYQEMGETPVDRVKRLLGKLDAVRRSEERGSEVAQDFLALSHKFVGQVESIFKNLPKPLEWRSFYNHDLPLLTELCLEVQEISIRHRLNKSQSKALGKLKDVSEADFQRIVSRKRTASVSDWESRKEKNFTTCLNDLSAREIEAIAEKAITAERQAERNRSKMNSMNSSSDWGVKIFMMDRLGIPVERIATRLGMEAKTISQHLAALLPLVEQVHEDLERGLPIFGVTQKYSWPESLVWSLALEEKSDQERFEALGWGLRTWDHWYFNELDYRFGDEWPGRIPAQLVAHTLFYFTHQGDLVFDPMAGGGVVADVCLAFQRKCRSFDLVDQQERRPEIEPCFWEREALAWPHQAKVKPDLIFCDPPYFSKKEGDYEEGSISSLSRKDYLQFFQEFFVLLKEHSKPSTRLAFLNADWRAFQGISAMKERPEEAILLSDYVKLLNKAGWEITHIIDCPLSTQRFHANMVAAMQKNRTLGVVRRSLIVARNVSVANQY